MQIIERQLLIADIRLKPYSRTPEWNRSRLESAIPGRYVWLGDHLGNRNYKGGPIDIVDLGRGIDELRTLARDAAVVVMCMCPKRAECHRGIVLDLLEADGWTVQELAPDLVP